jgi:uncharacterized protein YidB (DUF937 family)
MPSLAALLGLLAVAGYQNRDKLGEMLKGVMNPGGAPGGVDSPGAAGGLGEGGDPLKTIQGGLADVIDRFRNAGHGDAADSWVATGPNAPITANHTETALGPDLIDMLTQRTGLSRSELLARLSAVLPEAVDKLTPDGRMPAR